MRCRARPRRDKSELQRGNQMSEASKRKGGWLLPLVVVVGVIAVAFILPFGAGVRFYRMPSGSMQPTLHVGDHIMVTKWAYGYGRYSFAPFPGPNNRLLDHPPKRGDVAVFRPISEPDRDFVTRVVGLPGDRVQMIDGALHINGEAVGREALGEISFTDGAGETVRAQRYRETLPNGVSYVVRDRD